MNFKALALPSARLANLNDNLKKKHTFILSKKKKSKKYIKMTINIQLQVASYILKRLSEKDRVSSMYT